MYAGWLKHIDGVVDDLVATGRPKIMVLSQGEQGKIASFVNRDPRKATEFLELRPKSLDYSDLKKAGTFGDIHDAETLEFNLVLVKRLHERGFSFEVGDFKKFRNIATSADASSSWLKAELEMLESLGGKWTTISGERIGEVMKLTPWGRPRR